METCVDLFCGAGGFSCGFKDDKTRFIGIDSDPIKLETYAHNIGGETIKTDIMELDPSVLPKSVHKLIGSPPCQSHSNANRFATHDHSLIQKYVDLRDDLRPTWWVMEEVPGAAYVCDEAGRRIIKDWEIRFLKASDFGLPHLRNRLFAGNYPNPVKHPYKGEFWVSTDGKHKTRYIPTPMTGGIQAFGYERERGYPNVEKLKAMIKTPVAQIRGYGHGKDDRSDILARAIGLIGDGSAVDAESMRFCDIITPRFVAKIMGFPDDYVFSGTKDEQFVQIGNAVCPPVAHAIYLAIESGVPAKTQTTFF